MSTKNTKSAKKAAKPVKGNNASTMTDADVQQEQAPAPKEENKTPKQIAKQIELNSKSGDPFEFTDLDEGNAVYKLLPEGQYSIRETPDMVRITRN